jgi:hypothetical protein
MAKTTGNYRKGRGKPWGATISCHQYPVMRSPTSTSGEGGVVGEYNSILDSILV